jgi:hypothetical protein
MNDATANLLRAVAALANHAQAHPTDAPGIRLRAQGRSRAEAAWVAAGSPDLPSEMPRPAVMQKGVGHVDEEKDWSPVTLLVEVVNMTEKAYRFDPGDDAFWCPKAVVRESDPLLPEVGDVATVTVPRWVLP